MIWQPKRNFQQSQQSHQQQSSSVQRKTRRKASLPPLGLKNLGNTCYLNSVLQCLTYTPPLANYCLSNQPHSSICKSPPPLNCPFCILEKRIFRSLTLDTPATVDSPLRIHNSLSIFSDQFQLYRQEDAHEFLRYVIDACHNSCLKLNKLVGDTSGETVVKDIFGGELRSQVKCLSCGGESNKNDEFMDISLDLFQISSVNDAMQRFFQPEVLNGTNKYKCDNCDKLVVAKKQMSILKAPNVLVIQLKRFEGILGGKIDRDIAFEECLVLSNYMSKESQDPHPEYSLFGTIVHAGHSPESGHYYAYIKDTMGRWYCCNDSFVSLTTLQEVLTQRVYILFFTRTNQRPRPNKSSPLTIGVKPRNGHNAEPPKEAASLKSVSTRTHTPEKVIPTISKNGEHSSSSRVKFDFKALKSKELHGNGNGNISSNGNGGNYMDSKKVKDVEKILKERPLVTNSNGANINGSCNALQPETKPISQLPHGNGKTLGINVQPMKTEKSIDGGLEIMLAKDRRPDSSIASQNEDSSTISGCKRKILDNESSYSSSPDGNQATVEHMKEKLVKDASSHLRSCGWYNEVYGFMHAKKRLCAQTGGYTTNDIEPKKSLIEEAREMFKPKVPASLKAHLIDCLKSFYHSKPLLDA
ncbi:Ubiquitin carboxyl-terminal hydrolase [Thalictrum thalictroides]|uniref:Ubiquitin carboxyl-terminal hydrolase n=1 Tax=Thalictrum thalictroides TaxID=46969 RepID=A0A7J6VSP6_THATH|nr:Ubiquitin carboxyl-terminal hydrolase [Thalictrum thalictroides]